LRASRQYIILVAYGNIFLINGEPRSWGKEDEMANLYKIIEIIGNSPISYAEASKAAIAEASKTVREISWYEVKNMGGKVNDGAVVNFQVKLEVAFKVVE
jgi:dodecin